MYGSPYRAKRAEKLIAEVETAIRKHGARAAYFFDLEFTLNRDLVEALCDFLIASRANLNWCCQTRADMVNERLLRRMKRAGCSLIHCGIESGSPAVLERLNKGMSLEVMERGVRMIQGVGIRTACFFMFGFPDETEADMDATIRFAKRLNPTYASFHVAVPYPGAPLNDMLTVRETDEDPIWFRHPQSVLLGKVVRRALFRSYVRPGWLLRHLAEGDFQELLRGMRLLSGYFAPQR